MAKDRGMNPTPFPVPGIVPHQGPAPVDRLPEAFLKNLLRFDPFQPSGLAFDEDLSGDASRQGVTIAKPLKQFPAQLPPEDR
jgi:hypothetical protein